MIEFYAEIRLVHIGAVLVSGAIFLLRGTLLFSGGARPAAWAMAAPVRFLSYTVDTVLLTAALMLMTIVRQYPFVDAWLTAKVLLLALYIALGILAFRPGRRRPVRLACWLAALVVYAWIITVARAHDPLGVLAGLGA